MPFILRGREPAGHQLHRQPARRSCAQEVWRRLAGDLRPPLLKEMCRTIRFDQLPGVFDDFINASVNRRVVVDLAE